MASYGVKEARIHQERRARVNLCSCGAEIDSSELLCHACYVEVHGHADEVCKVETEMAAAMQSGAGSGKR